MPYNRKMMVKVFVSCVVSTVADTVQLMQALHRLAAAHAMLPAFKPTQVWQYDMIIKANVADFVQSLQPWTSSNLPVFSWTYVAGSKVIEEAKGIHGFVSVLYATLHFN